MIGFKGRPLAVEVREKSLKGLHDREIFLFCRSLVLFCLREEPNPIGDLTKHLFHLFLHEHDFN